MPVLVVGADTLHGAAICRALDRRQGERRAFVSDPTAAEALRERSWKVAIGDVTDSSHVEGAALGCFSVVVVPEAAFDERERSFARSPAATMTAWMKAVRDAGVQRVIVLDDDRVAGAADGFGSAAPEIGRVDTEGRDPADVAAEVASLDDLAQGRLGADRAGRDGFEA